MAQYKSSEILINALKQFEGLRLKAYKAVKTERYYTIGYGHYGSDVMPGTVITEPEAERLLRLDLQKAEQYVNSLGVCKTQGQYDALVDFSFNCGISALAKSTLLKKIRAGAKTSDIQAEFRRWNKSGGKVLGGLTKRREWEARRWAE